MAENTQAKKVEEEVKVEEKPQKKQRQPRKTVAEIVEDRVKRGLENFKTIDNNDDYLKNFYLSEYSSAVHNATVAYNKRRESGKNVNNALANKERGNHHFAILASESEAVRSTNPEVSDFVNKRLNQLRSIDLHQADKNVKKYQSEDLANTRAYHEALGSAVVLAELLVERKYATKKDLSEYSHFSIPELDSTP